MCEDWIFGDDFGDGDSSSDMGGDLQQDYAGSEAGSDYPDYCIEKANSAQSIYGTPTDEINALGPVPQEIFVNGRYLIINLDGTVTTFDNQIVCTVNSSEVGTIWADDIRILEGIRKIEYGY